VKKRRARSVTPAPAPPTVPDLILAPELAAVALLEHALDMAVSAIRAEHPELADDLARERDADPAAALALTICRRSGDLLDTLHRYRRAVRDAAPSADLHDDDVAF